MFNRPVPTQRCFLLMAAAALFWSGVLFGAPTAIVSKAAPVQEIQAPRFRALVLTENGGLHAPFVEAARVWLKQHEGEDHFTTDWIENTEPITKGYLAKYQLIIQLNYPPYTWTPAAMEAFREYIEKGKGGWIGFHHATLLGEFDGYNLWPWFSTFMGGIRFENYIATFADGTVHVEDKTHPCMKNLPGTFPISQEEWYTYDKSPRPNVHVLASVDEASYTPTSTMKMGDHPVVWTNEHIAARNIYIFMGHRAEHFQNPAFTTLFHNSLLWAAGYSTEVK